MNNDTIFFRSTTNIDSSDSITFVNFDFSRKTTTRESLKNFMRQDDVYIQPFLLHRYVVRIRQVQKGINLLLSKDIYDSRADEFTFQKIK
jgi:hypothetical protein